MAVFVVITNYMDANQDEALFSTMNKANNYLKCRSNEGNPKIIEIQIIGDSNSSKELYTASRYDKSLDIHHFLGVYRTYEAAEKAAGKNGLVLKRVLDDRL